MERERERERVFKRLDRALCSIDWRLHFHEAVVYTLPRICSDHHPFCVSCSEELVANNGPKPFRFQVDWLIHDGFENLVKNNWSKGEDLCVNLQNLSDTLTYWNKSTFGNVFKEKRRLVNRLNDIQ